MEQKNNWLLRIEGKEAANGGQRHYVSVINFTSNPLDRTTIYDDDDHDDDDGDDDDDDRDDVDGNDDDNGDRDDVDGNDSDDDGCGNVDDNDDDNGGGKQSPLTHRLLIRNVAPTSWRRFTASC